jgi:cytochrome c oxidase subunit 3
MAVNTAAETVHEKKGDYTGSKMGMWLFLFTEVLFFGGMFLLYAVYRSEYLAEFHRAASGLSKTVGGINTIILITSSLTMALSITAMKKADKKLSLLFQTGTILLGLTFIILKYIEWSAKISNGIFPGSPELLGHEQGEIIFYSLYFVMTGLHGLHVLIGIVLLVVILGMSNKGSINENNFIILENSGLYWHFVDIVWIYLFPLLYLIT